MENRNNRKDNRKNLENLNRILLSIDSAVGFLNDVIYCCEEVKLFEEYKDNIEEIIFDLNDLRFDIEEEISELTQEE